jgi:hypothetical protein
MKFWQIPSTPGCNFFIDALAPGFFKLLDLVLGVLIVGGNPSIANVHEPLYHPADLFDTEERKTEINKKTTLLSVRLGGAPDHFIVKKGARVTDIKDKFDDFVWSTIDEMVALFGRSRNMVVKAHCAYATRWILKEGPGVMEKPFSDEKLGVFLTVVTEDFCQYTEDALIRLASLWDRVGQLLDYVFFNIRQYERDGFPAVFDRIKANVVHLDPTVEKTAFWSGLKSYCNSEQTNGFRWLLRRRNLLVHSMHLGATRDREKEDSEIRYYYNHLEEAIRNKLRTLSFDDELKAIHCHLRAFAASFESILDLSLWGAGVIHEVRREKDILVW